MRTFTRRGSNGIVLLMERGEATRGRLLFWTEMCVFDPQARARSSLLDTREKRWGQDDRRSRMSEGLHLSSASAEGDNATNLVLCFSFSFSFFFFRPLHAADAENRLQLSASAVVSHRKRRSTEGNFGQERKTKHRRAPV